jgi:hypothetical protein
MLTVTLDFVNSLSPLRAGIQHQIDGVAFEHRLPANAMPAENRRGKFGLQGCEPKAIGMIMLGDPLHGAIAQPTQSVEEHQRTTAYLFAQHDFTYRCGLAHSWPAPSYLVQRIGGDP